MGILLDYVKCSIRNKFTLAGYLGVAIGTTFHVVGFAFNQHDFQYAAACIDFPAALCLLLTGFGHDTYDTYAKTKKRFQRHGSLNYGFIELYSDVYCNRVGLKMAAREAGIEISFDDFNI